MAFLDDTQRTALLDRANEALLTGDDSKSHEIYRDIVETLSRLCNKNQKEIAQELQTMAKMLEDRAELQAAFEFKQRTCAVMLELSMEERRKSRLAGTSQTAPLAPAAAQPLQPPAQTPLPAAVNQMPAGTQSPNGPGMGTHNQDFSPVPRRTKIIGGPETSYPGSGLGPASWDSDSSPTTVMQASAVAIDSALPFLSLDYMYIGSSNYDTDIEYYTNVLGAQEVWKFDRFGSRITAFSLCAGPLLLIADHRHAPSCQPVFRVSDLAATTRDLKERGWKQTAGPFGTPNGEGYSFEDPSGNRFAIYQVDETSTDRAYFDPTEYE